MEYQMRNWYHFVWLCGDHIVEQHVHNLDVGNWVKDAHPVEANGMGGRQVPQRPDGDRPDLRPPLRRVHLRRRHEDVQPVPPHRQQLGQRLRARPRHQGRRCAANRQAARPFAASRNPYDQEHVDLIDAIRNDKKLQRRLARRHEQLTAVLGRMATYSGQVVNWDDAVAKRPGRDAQEVRLGRQSARHARRRRQLPDAVPGVYKPY